MGVLADFYRCALQPCEAPPLLGTYNGAFRNRSEAFPQAIRNALYSIANKRSEEQGLLDPAVAAVIIYNNNGKLVVQGVGGLRDLYWVACFFTY